MAPKNIAVLSAELVIELDTLTNALQLACNENNDDPLAARRLFVDLLNLVAQSEAIWVKNIRLCTAALATIHLFIAQMPAADQIILRLIFDPSTKMISPLARVVQTPAKSSRSGKRSKFRDNSAYFMHKVAKTEHNCANFNICVLREAGLCTVPEDDAIAGDATLEYIYYKEGGAQCLHFHVQCYDKHVVNEEYMQAMWTVKQIDFRTPELYHVIEIGPKVKCFACQASAFIKLETEDGEVDLPGNYIAGDKAMLYYASVSVNSHVLCVPCFTKLQLIPNVRKCDYCSTYANPTAVVAHLHGGCAPNESGLAATSVA